MGKIRLQLLKLLDIKKAVHFLVIVFMLSACTDSNPKNDNSLQTMDAVTEKTVGVTYTQFPLAYLVDGELFFHRVVDNKKVKFTEEPSAIFNFTFDTEGTTLYYSVERENTLWLKSADISAAKVTPQWLIDWQLAKDESITETYDEASPLLYHQGKLLIQHGFSWDSYHFTSMAIYSIEPQKMSRKKLDYDVIQTYTGELSFDKAEQYFTAIEQQLYYTGNNAKVSLTDRLNLAAHQEPGDGSGEIEFTGFLFSPDKTKVLFGAITGWGDLPHGPYIIVNVDGSKQMLLEKTDIASDKKPVWLKNNRVAFIDSEKNLFTADNDEHSTRRVAENVSDYVAK